jgi:polar amino acid transport system substrate-binding protein
MIDIRVQDRSAGISTGAFVSAALATVLLLAAIAVSGCAEKPRQELIVGMELNYPPFEMIDLEGRPAGISVEMAGALAKHLGRPLKIENIPFDGLIPALKTGRIDLIISSMTATAERSESIDFSEPYLRTGLCLLVNSQAPIHSIEDADQPGYVLAVKQGTTGQLYAKKHLKHAQVLALDKEDAAVLEVVQGKAQAFIYDQLSVLEDWRRNIETTTAILKPFQEENWAIGIQKGDDRMRIKVNAFLKEFRAAGGFNRLGEKYLKEQEDTFRKLGIPLLF